jgi:hypothetical protein
MIDTATPVVSRRSLSDLINSYLDGEISAFSFDDNLDAFRDSDDSVIRYVAETAWLFYDDCRDHFVNLSKSEWDLFQRLLLILSSDCHVETESSVVWSFRQVVAASALCLFFVVVYLFGFGQHLLIFSVPFGVVSIGLSFWRTAPDAPTDPYSDAIFPFATFGDLANAYHSAGFRKTRYPKGVGATRVRSPFMDRFWQCHTYIIWMILSPIPLLFQTFPLRRSVTRIKAA